MKKFRYRFEKILAFRRYLEKQKQRELGVVQNMELQQKQKLSEIAADRLLHQKQEREYLMGRIEPDKLKDFNRYYLLLEKMEMSGREVLAQISREIDKKRGELVEASKKKKIYEKLKERHREKYNREIELVLQKENDEVASRRR